MNQLFNFNGNDVRTVSQNGEPWFVLNDVVQVLGLSNARMVKERISNDVSSTYTIPDALGRPQDTTIINEDGLYDVILESRKPEARAFRKWITSEVIPSIRKTGSYSIQHQLPQDYKQALIALVAQVEETEQARAETLLIQAKVEEQRPLVFFAESIQISKDSILVNDMSTLLKQNGVDIGEKRLFAWLRENGYLIKSGSEYNMPTQRSMDLKIMEVKMGSRNSSDGTVKITRTPKITGKGQVYFINKFADKIA
jgi:anti-repressor protein